MTSLASLIGHRFGRYTVADLLQREGTNRYLLCRCDCGQERRVAWANLVSGRSTSCGCLRDELASKRALTHGESNWLLDTAEYRAWRNMKDRCYRQDNKSFKDYGGRGIRVCERWLDSYEAFLQDMGRRPSAKYSIDRIDVDGHYEPANCRWATKVEQMRNTRRCRSYVERRTAA